MGCYKGYDKESFTKTCGADPKFFKKQFEMHKKLIQEGLDVYSYLYPLIYSEYSDSEIRKKLSQFISRLQQVDLYAPARLTTPYTKEYSPTKQRTTSERKIALKLQYRAIKIWKQEMRRLYGSTIASYMPHQIPAKT